MYFPKIFTNYFSKVAITHDHYTRTLQGVGLTVKYAVLTIGSLH